MPILPESRRLKGCDEKTLPNLPESRKLKLTGLELIEAEGKAKGERS